MIKTEIPQDIVQAYLETDYRVHAEPAFTLRVGNQSAELMAHHKILGKVCSTFITAWNPWSKQLGILDNKALNAALLTELDHLGLTYTEGVGQHPSNAWLGEESFLVFGLPLDESKALGSRYEQNALIWCGEDATPQLILLR